ncbi:hypothetical protein OQ497_04805 [Acetobacter thailandicus]|uniref:Exonuclease domain-containing protein n=1 Tax=Acetobacter thailandicus TaxID=1502842 RepID=A0ABT3QDB3_9PROT|nr:hypothetical protein [Acetobacter thailandicus]
MILFYDTETTGLPDKYCSLDDPKQPRCVQLAAILTDDKALSSHVLIWLFILTTGLSLLAQQLCMASPQKQQRK